MTTIVIEQDWNPKDLETEDGGMAKIYTMDGNPTDESAGLFVRIQSWDETTNHVDFSQFVGKKIRVTIESID